MHVDIMSLKGGTFFMWILRMLKAKEKINECIETGHEVRMRIDGAS